eukprot:4176018-Amphidinium_carterae.1
MARHQALLGQTFGRAWQVAMVRSNPWASSVALGAGGSSDHEYGFGSRSPLDMPPTWDGTGSGVSQTSIERGTSSTRQSSTTQENEAF